MRQVKVAIAQRMVALAEPIEYNTFEVPETVEEAIREARILLRECRCEELPCTRCAVIEVLLREVRDANFTSLQGDERGASCR